MTTDSDTEAAVVDAVSLAIERDSNLVLLVRRPPEDPELPDHWGLPATTVAPGESPEDAARRIGPAKLGVTVDLHEPVAMGSLDREGTRFTMTLYDAKIRAGTPTCPQPAPGTQYVDWQWAAPSILRPAAAAGSLCSALYLDSRSLPFERPASLATGDHS